MIKNISLDVGSVGIAYLKMVNNEVEIKSPLPNSVIGNKKPSTTLHVV
jgi:hypothetical protein